MCSLAVLCALMFAPLPPGKRASARADALRRCENRVYFFPQPSMVTDPVIRVRERDDLPMSGVTLLVEVRDYLDRGMDIGSDFGGRYPCRRRLLSRSDRRHTTGLAVSGLTGEL